jgi:archaemetzincin
MEPIFLWWIGERAARPEVMEHVRWHLERAFGTQVVLWEGPERPQDTFDPKRRQHYSGRMLKWLLERAPGGGKVLGLTDRDLFIPILTYVFGEAQLGGRVAVASTARLLEGVELAGPRLLHERLAKEAVHEVGHAYGLVHCSTPRCVMGRAAGVRDVDEKSSELCASCRLQVADPGRRRHVQ